MRPIYLDYNATAPLRPEARAAVIAALEQTGNASSIHAFGRRARHLVEAARASVAALAGARPEQVVFTSGGTEANNMALRAGGRRVLASAGEHDSVLQAGVDRSIPLTPDGIVDLQALETALKDTPGPALVSIMLANNETGAIQPVAAAARAAHDRGAILHCDAVQAAGKLPLDLAELGADMLSLSAHKLGGPQGVGALVLGEGVEAAPLLRGGGQERRRRAGTENVAAIAGFGAAARVARERIDRITALARARDELERGLRALAPGVTVHGAAAPRLANTSCFGIPGATAEFLVMALDLEGVAVGAGSACSSGKLAPSHVLRAMGVGAAESAEAIRVSLGWASAPEDVAGFLAALRSCLGRRAEAARAAG